MIEIKGFPNYYISKEGNVYSTLSCKYLKPILTRTGYCLVDLRNGEKKTKRYIHRILLENYVGPCPLGQQTRHLNGQRSDNRLENLRWGTPQENANDKIRHGTTKNVPSGEEHSESKLTKTDVRWIRFLHKNRVLKNKEIEELFNICPSHLHRVVTRQAWNHI